MKNMEIEIKGKKAIITIDLTQETGLSNSKKTMLVATSEGNTALDPPYEHIRIGLNMYKPLK